MPGKLPPYFYPLAKQHMDSIAAYSKQWGKKNAIDYILKLTQAINRLNEGKHDKPFPKTQRVDRLKEEVYYFYYKRKSSDRHGYCIFYRRLSGGNIGVIAIIESSRDLPDHLYDAIEQQEDHN